jgi:predicted PolB exonuclease-like 3'-5' exonuclease
MTPVLAFDIETVPDCAGIRRLHDLPHSLSDAEIAEVAFQRRRTQANTDFLPLHLHRVIVISCVLRDDEGVRVFSIGEPERDERATIQRFFDGIEKLTPQLVSWNGGGFDLPVLQLRGMIHGVTAPRYWDLGDEDRDFRYNNYLGRYHTRHCDLMDLMGLYQPRNNAPLDEVAQLAGLPGKIGLSGAGVWGEYLAGGIARIREYCEADCANTYLLWLRFQRMRGAHSDAQHAQECAQLREWIGTQQTPPWREFLNRWQSA